MTLVALDSSKVSNHTALCPPPLHIRKKTHRTAFRKRIPRRSTHHRNNNQYVYGPLDDIIEEIRNKISDTPRDYITEAPLLGWATVPSTWTVTPLPISRLPSNQPLTIRKNRESRSSTSGSSMGDPLYFPRASSQGYTFDGGPVGTPESVGGNPWPLFDAPTLYEPAHPPNAGAAGHCSNIDASESVSQNAEARPIPTKRRPSVLRILTGFSRLRRTDTDEICGNGGEASDIASPASVEAHNDDDMGEDVPDEPSEDAIEAYIRKNARNGARLGSIISRIARRLPSPVEHQHDDQETQSTVLNGNTIPTLRAAVRVFSEVVLLSQQEHQDFWIAVEVEGVLHNRLSPPDSTIDVIFIVDNAYYVSKDSLGRALDAVNSALYHLNRGDRVALYATHCTHKAVTGNRPDLLFPITPFNIDTEEIFRALTAAIMKYGTQSWKPPRPNPLMAEVILSVVRCLENKDMGQRRTHIVLLSPAAHVLHDVSKSCPDLFIHQINPATVPYRPASQIGDVQCMEECCKNVFVNNWNYFQSLPGCIKRILKYARSMKPAGEITKVCIDVRARHGCEVVECSGTKDIASLRPGQVHTIFARVRTTRAATKAVDLLSRNPVFNSSLNVKDLRQQLQNAEVLGAVKAHLLDIQVYHQNTLHGADCWNYTETPFLVVRELGGLAAPFDSALEVHKRRILRKFVQLDTSTAKAETETLLFASSKCQEPLKKLVQCIFREVDHYQQVQNYEQEYRQKLPLCPGPIAIEASPHEWLVDVWNKRKTKRQGLAVVEGEDISGLNDGLQGLERLG